MPSPIHPGLSPPQPQLCLHPDSQQCIVASAKELKAGWKMSRVSFGSGPGLVLPRPRPLEVRSWSTHQCMPGAIPKPWSWVRSQSLLTQVFSRLRHSTH